MTGYLDLAPRPLAHAMAARAAGAGDVVATPLAHGHRRPIVGRDPFRRARVFAAIGGWALVAFGEDRDFAWLRADRLVVLEGDHG